MAVSRVVRYFALNKSYLKKTFGTPPLFIFTEKNVFG